MQVTFISSKKHVGSGCQGLESHVQDPASRWWSVPFCPALAEKDFSNRPHCSLSSWHLPGLWLRSTRFQLQCLNFCSSHRNWKLEKPPLLVRLASTSPVLAQPSRSAWMQTSQLSKSRNIHPGPKKWCTQDAVFFTCRSLFARRLHAVFATALFGSVVPVSCFKTSEQQAQQTESHFAKI